MVKRIHLVVFALDTLLAFLPQIEYTERAFPSGQR